MDLHERFQLKGFKDFLSRNEDAERHLLHECGHVWVGEQHGAEVVQCNLRPGAVSDVFLRGLKTPEAEYETGVAGLLAEAKGILPYFRHQALLDLDRMRPLANRIYRGVLEQKDDPDGAIYPHVPLTSRIPSTMWAELSVSDLAGPIRQGLSEERLFNALITVSRHLNDPVNWERFLVSVEERRRGLQ